MKPYRHSGGTSPPSTGALLGKIGSAGNEDSAINVYFSHLEAMRADGQQPEQSPSHFLWTSVRYESKVCDVPESSSFTQGEQPIRIAC